MFTKTKILLSFILITVLTLLVTATLALPDNSEPRPSQYGAIEYPATVIAAVNQCGSVFYFEPDPKWYGTIPISIQQNGPDDGIPAQPTNIPVYGYMTREPFNPEFVGTYDKTFEGFSRQDINRAMWDGYYFIWYSMNTPNDKYEQLVEFVETQNSRTSTPKIILSPFKITDREIPSGRDIAFSTWGVSQSCDTFDPKIFEAFEDFTIEHSTPRGEPPVAPIAPYGGLYPITPEYRPARG